MEVFVVINESLSLHMVRNIYFYCFTKTALIFGVIMVLDRSSISTRTLLVGSEVLYTPIV